VCVLYYRLCFAITSNLVFFLSIIDHILFIFFLQRRSSITEFFQEVVSASLSNFPRK